MEIGTVVKWVNTPTQPSLCCSEDKTGIFVKGLSQKQGEVNFVQGTPLIKKENFKVIKPLNASNISCNNPIPQSLKRGEKDEIPSRPGEKQIEPFKSFI